MPENQLPSVDDILKEVRQMREQRAAAAAGSQAPTEKPAIKPEVKAQQPADHAVKDRKPGEPEPVKSVQNNISEQNSAPQTDAPQNVQTSEKVRQDIGNSVTLEELLRDHDSEFAADMPDKPAAPQDEKPIKDYKSHKSFEHTVERDYTPDTESVKEKLDLLFSDSDAADAPPVNLFRKKRQRSANVLSAEEINKGSFAKEPEGFEATRIMDKIGSSATPAEKTPEKAADPSLAQKPDSASPITGGFKVVLDEDLPEEETQETIQKPASRLPQQDPFKTLVYGEDDLYAKEEPQPEQTFTSEAEGAVSAAAGADDDDFETIPPAEQTENHNRSIRHQTIEFEEEPQEEYQYIEDYKTIDDAESIKLDLLTRSSRLSKKITATAILFLLSLALTVLPSFGFSLSEGLSPAGNTMAFLVINAVITGLACLVNITTICRGLFHLIKLNPDADTAVGIAALGAVLQSGFAFQFSDGVASGDVRLYAAAAIFVMLFSCIGKKAILSRVKANFRMVATTDVKQSCFIADEKSSEKLTDDSFVGPTPVACSKSVVNLEHFLENSYCEDPSDNLIRILSAVVFLAALAVSIIVHMTGGGLMGALTCFAVITSAGVPVTSLCATNMPLRAAAARVRRAGGMLSGYRAVDEFSETECVAIDAEELFPPGSIDLISLKSVGDFSVDNMILDAAALVIAAGGPMADVFDRMIEGRRKILPQAQGVYYEDGLGISGVVAGRYLQFGNRRMMEKLGITELPDREKEMKARRNSCYTAYLACDNRLCGMFVVKYNAQDDEILNGLYRLTDEGVTLLIKTNDPNITAQFMETLFAVPKELVRILPSAAVEELDRITAPEPAGNSILAHHNTISGLSEGIVVCKRLYTRMILATVVQALFAVLGLGVSVYMGLTGAGVYSLLLPHILIVYQCVSAFLVLALPHLRRL